MPNAASESTTRITDSARLWETVVADDTAFLLARANALSLAAANRTLAEFGLKVRSYSVLALAVSGTRPTQREFSEFLRLDPSQIVALIDELEQAGLARREPDVHDRRVKVVVATERGAEVYRQAQTATARAEVDVFGSLGEERLEQFKAALRILASSESAAH